MNSVWIKLPRKRKKAYIKKHGIAEYAVSQIIGRILYEERPGRKATRFPELELSDGKLRILFNW